jgi:tetratricopeptide (TPR) repeat protein
MKRKKINSTNSLALEYPGGFEMSSFQKEEVIFFGILAGIAAFIFIYIRTSFPKKKAIILRKDKSLHASEQNRISDRMKLTAAQSGIQKKAETLAKNGEFMKAAKLLENLGLPRQAIQLLEDFGAVDEACRILMKMNRPNRAAVIYERHHKFVKAAEHYLLANLPEDAGRCYFAAGVQDISYYEKSANLLESCNHFNEAIQAYEAAGNLPEILRLCIKHQIWDSLRVTLNNPKNTVEGIELMTAMDLKRFVKSLPINFETAQNLASWCHKTHRKELINASLKIVVRNTEVCIHFWNHLPNDFIKSVCQTLIQAAQTKKKEWVLFVSKQAHCLYEANKHAFASLLYAACERFLMVFKCEVILGNYNNAMLALEKLPQEQSSVDVVFRKLKEAGIKNVSLVQKNSSEEKKLVEILSFVLEAVDAEADVREVASPFTLSA